MAQWLNGSMAQSLQVSVFLFEPWSYSAIERLGALGLLVRQQRAKAARTHRRQDETPALLALRLRRPARQQVPPAAPAADQLAAARHLESLLQPLHRLQLWHVFLTSCSVYPPPVSSARISPRGPGPCPSARHPRRPPAWPPAPLAAPPS